MQNNPNFKFSFNCINILNKEIALLVECINKYKVVGKRVAILLTTKDIPSEKYVQNKMIILEKLGIQVDLTRIFNASKKLIKDWLDFVNNSNTIIGVIIQYPVSTNNRKELVNQINKYKDLDALNKYWNNTISKLGYIEKTLIPPAAFSIKKILENKDLFQSVFRKCKEEGINTIIIEKLLKNSKELTFHVVGQSLLTGKPIIDFLQYMNYSVSTSNINTSKQLLSRQIKNANIIITATGSQNAIDEKVFIPGQILIDFGRHYIKNKAYGDIQNELLKYGVIHTQLFKSTGYATIAGIIRNLRICITNFGKK